MGKRMFSMMMVAIFLAGNFFTGVKAGLDFKLVDSKKLSEAVVKQKLSKILPQFQLPYGYDPDDPTGYYEPVVWSGGPHEYGNLVLNSDFLSEHGSGIDFAPYNKFTYNWCDNQCSFIVRAMADGEVIWKGEGSFGNQVAVKHDIGGSVIIYGHLYDFYPSIEVGYHVSEGSAIGHAGFTHDESISSMPIHLHVELRDGSESCSTHCIDEPYGLGGNPVSWNGKKIGNYTIHAYQSKINSAKSYNYDGVAIKESNWKVQINESFVFADVDSNDHKENKPAITTLPVEFSCNYINSNCEVYNNFSYYSLDVVFAGHGIFGGGGVLSASTSIDSSDASFISDITIPDGTVVSPSQSLTKTWRIKNTGTTTWGSGYQLVFLRGDRLGAVSEINLPSVSPGSTTDLSVNITAPGTQGSYKGYWRLRNSQGTYFGPEFWVDIKIEDSSVGTPTEQYEVGCINCPSVVSPGYIFRPTIRVQVVEGQLLETRGDMLVNTNNNLYGAYPHVAVAGSVISGQTYDFQFYVDHPIVAPQQDGTYESKWRIWRNGAYAGPEYSIKFTVSQSAVNHPPNTPSLVDPGDWAVFVGTGGITLRAEANGDPDGDAVNQYYFEIFESHDTPNSGWITSNSWTPSGLGYYGYQWRVKVKDARGVESGWSDVRHFNIKNPTTEIYSFSWQWCRDAWGGPEKVCFCATTSGGGLELKLNSASDGSESGSWKTIGHADTNINCNTDSDNPINWGQLEAPAGSYRVRLYQRPNVGGWDDSNTADVVVSLPANQRPGSPDILTPINHSYNNSTATQISWKATYRTTDYRLIVDDNPDFLTPIINRHFPFGTNQFDYDFQNEVSALYVKVISTGPYGTNEHDNEFYIDMTAPISNIVSLPPITTETNFTVSWGGNDARSGLRWYDIQFKDGNRPDSVWQNWMVNTIITAALFEGQTGHTYYFRSRAMDKIGNWEQWTLGEGDTYTLVDPLSAPPTPWWNNDYSFKHNIVILNNDTDPMPAHFPVRVHFDATTIPTASEIYNNSLSSVKGNDVRIIYNNAVELPRYFQRFSETAIDIWFPLQSILSGGATNNTGYQIYYSNPSSGTPTVNLNDIFLPLADSNTMGLWRFYENSGTVIHDLSGRNHPGTFYNGNWVDGLMGWAGSFNGTNTYVEVPNSNDLNPGAITLESWFYLTGNTLNHPMIISKDYYYIKIDNDRKLKFSINANGGGRTLQSSTAVNLNQWYHVAATYDGNGHMKLYINGRLDSQHDEAPLTILYTNLPLRIGRMSNVDPNVSAYITGYIQNARISNVARTDFSYGKIDIRPSIALGIRQEKPVTGSTDLNLLSLNSYTNDSGSLLIQAVVRNDGTISTTNGFYTDLYVDHLPTGIGDYTGSLQFWVNDPIEAGETVNLTTVLEANQVMISPKAPLVESTGVLYAQTDSPGALNDDDRSNNITEVGTEICFANADGYEGDDTYSTATSFTGSQTHNFENPGDVDWIKITTETGEEYTIRTNNLGVYADTVMYVYRSDGTTLVTQNDDYGGSLGSQVSWVADVNGYYYIKVVHWNPNVAGCGTRYTITSDGNNVFLPFLTK